MDNTLLKKRREKILMEDLVKQGIQAVLENLMPNKSEIVPESIKGIEFVNNGIPCKYEHGVLKIPLEDYVKVVVKTVFHEFEQIHTGINDIKEELEINRCAKIKDGIKHFKEERYEAALQSIQRGIFELEGSIEKKCKRFGSLPNSIIGFIFSLRSAEDLKSEENLIRGSMQYIISGNMYLMQIYAKRNEKKHLENQIGDVIEFIANQEKYFGVLDGYNMSEQKDFWTKEGDVIKYRKNLEQLLEWIRDGKILIDKNPLRIDG